MTMFDPHDNQPGPSRRPFYLSTNTPTSDLADLPLAGPSSAPPSLSTFPQSSDSSLEEDRLDVVPSRSGRQLCVRHKQMANQNINAKLQKSLDSLPTSERSAITHLWSTFSNAPHAKRKLILEGILTMCCFSQLSHLSDSLNQIIRIDPFSLLPREVNLRILGYLDAISLGRAAQVNKSWKALADDDLLWRRMCGQHIDRKCEKCGWGLPLLERRRLKVELKDRSPAAAVSIGDHHSHSHHPHDGHDHDHGHEPTKVVTRVEALGGKASQISEMFSARRLCDTSTALSAHSGTKRPAVTPPATSSNATKKAKWNSDSENEGCGVDKDKEQARQTRPWKTVYCERLVVERNWRKGRCQTKTLKGHKDGVMCLQYHTSLTNPSYPVLITGSYDRTIRIWNLDTGALIRSLTGHTRAVRALQFDQMLLFTGSLDGTVRMWNWRAGECLRVLEGHSDGVVSLNYNGYLLATGSADNTINVWNFRSGNKMTLRGHEDGVNSVLLWDGKTSPGDLDPSIMPSFLRQKSTNPHSTAASTTGSSTTSTPPLSTAEQPSKEAELDEGAMLFSGSNDGTVKLWDLKTATCVRTYEGHKASVESIKLLMVDMSESEVAAEEHRRTMRQRALTPPTQHGGFVSAANLHTPSPSPLHAEIDYEPHAHLASTERNRVEPKVFVHTASLVEGKRQKKKTTASVGDGEARQKKAVLATGSLDGTIKLWDVETGEERQTLFGHIEGVWNVDMDALRMASASHDRTIKVWDRESGNCEQTLVGHRGAVNTLQLSDDMIVSGSDDGDVMVWNFGPSVTASNANGTGSGGGRVAVAQPKAV